MLHKLIQLEKISRLPVHLRKGRYIPSHTFSYFFILQKKEIKFNVQELFMAMTIEDADRFRKNSSPSRGKIYEKNRKMTLQKQTKRNYFNEDAFGGDGIMKLLLILDWYFPRFLVYECNLWTCWHVMKIHDWILNYLFDLIATYNVCLNVGQRNYHFYPYGPIKTGLNVMA